MESVGSPTTTTKSLNTEVWAQYFYVTRPPFPGDGRAYPWGGMNSAFFV